MYRTILARNSIVYLNLRGFRAYRKKRRKKRCNFSRQFRQFILRKHYLRSSRLEIVESNIARWKCALISSGQREAHRLRRFTDSYTQITRQIINCDDSDVSIEMGRTLSILLLNDASNGPRRLALEEREIEHFSLENKVSRARN